jgi:signal transduction histidine kinase
VAQGPISPSALLKALAGPDPLGDLQSILHRQAVDAIRGRSAILFQFDATGEWLHATSAYDVDPLPIEPLRSNGGLVPEALFLDRRPMFVADIAQSVRDVADYLSTPSAVLVPLIYMDERLGVLAVGCRVRPPAALLDELTSAGHAFALALHQERGRRSTHLQRGSTTLLDDFSRSVSSASRLPAALEELCVGAKRLFGATGSSVWLHDRRAGVMNLSAASEPLGPEAPRRVSVSDALAPAAIALRRGRADITPRRGSSPNVGIIRIPLRGRRRALGALLLEDVRLDPGTDGELLKCADQIGVQLSAAVENVLLLDELLTPATQFAAVSQPADPPRLAGRAEDEAPLDVERSETRNKLIQTEKLAALGQFVAGIAHELNNPLQAVLGHLELMRATGAFPRTLRRDVQRIYREADRAAKIVRNLLIFAGSRRLVRRRVSVSTALTRVFTMRAPALRAEGIEVVRHRHENLPRVKADPLLLQQALLNIVLNAEQAIALDGRIETTEQLLKNPPRILIEIRDTGPGFPPGVLPRIFEPFYTTKEVGKGTGLGLAIAYGIVQEHGGQISAANHPDGGAVFSVQLPVEPTEIRVKLPNRAPDVAPPTTHG